MRIDYFKKGPPWKLYFENSIGFHHTMIIQDKLAPEYFEFPIVKRLGDLSKVLPKFKKVGTLGNVVAYREVYNGAKH